MILSRRDPELIKTLFELEVPEIADGLVEIRGVAREPGYRSKIAVESHAQGVDPVGACVGPRGSRVRMVVSELRGEKIDIIPWNDEPARFLAKALSPARVREVLLDDDAREATVIVPDDQLALAIGKEGLNARLASRLTGWKIDITSDSEFAQQEAGRPTAGTAPRARTSPAAAPRSSPTASAAPTRRCPGRATAACPRTRRSWAPRRSVLAEAPSRPRRRRPRRPRCSSRWPPWTRRSTRPSGSRTIRRAACRSRRRTWATRRTRRRTRRPSRSRRGSREAPGRLFRPTTWRTTAIGRDARAGQDVRRLRAEGAAAGSFCASSRGRAP